MRTRERPAVAANDRALALCDDVRPPPSSKIHDRRTTGARPRAVVPDKPFRGGESDGAANAFLAHLTKLLLEGLDCERMLKSVAHAVGSELDAGCVIALHEGTRTRRIAYAPRISTSTLTRALAALEDRVVYSGAIATPMDPRARHAAAELGAAWLLVVPLRGRGAPLGTMTIFGTRTDHSIFSLVHVEDLGQRVALAVEQCRAHAEALAAVHHREQVLATVSHDLRSPLGVIMLHAAQLLEGPPDRRVAHRRKIEAVQRSAHRMRRLVDDLLDLNALDTGALSVRPARCSVRAVLDDALHMFAPVALEGAVTLEDAAPDILPEVWADEGRLLQVLSNVVGNAIKFTRPGGRVRLRAHTSNGAVAIAVDDTGIGVARSEVPMVFDRFWRAEKSSRNGNGLGLSICKAILEQMGGKIELTSELGVGTTVTLTLQPAENRTASGDPPPPAKLDPSAKRSAPWSGPVSTRRWPPWAS
jgi:signal transduction histidine kinase